MGSGIVLCIFLFRAFGHPAVLEAREGIAPAAQQAGVQDELRVQFASGESMGLQVERHRGFAAVAASTLAPLGWQAAVERHQVRIRHRTGIDLRFTPGSPFMRWDDELLQMVDAPYLFGGDLWVSVQLLVDFFPGMLPNAYNWNSGSAVLEVREAPRPVAGRAAEVSTRPDGVIEARPEEAARPDRPSRVVIIDAGHGGDDVGALGPGGTREKDVALAISRALQRALAEDPDIEVHMTRNSDELVPIWNRGEMATLLKDGRTGVFLSIHANAVPDRPGVRGFETFFLSEARTEHERRVAAAENAPLHSDRPSTDGPPPMDDPLLDAILRDLRTFDHQQWSSLLAELVQEELGTFHPGPDRGVKQGPFAVITNSMMPSVLVEVGFLTNPDEERLLNQSSFQAETARALVRAVNRFFERYPSGGG